MNVKLSRLRATKIHKTMELPMPNHGQPDETDSSNTEEPLICAVCRNEPPVNGVGLDCRHIFCYLCLKGVAETSGCCPLCRREIPMDFDFKEHTLLGIARIPFSSTGYYWFYEGFRGWWLFDPDSNSAIEEAHTSGQKTLERLIAGHYYVIDLEKMEQHRRDGGRNRKICRETLELDNILGLAGIRGADFQEILSMMRSMNQFNDPN